MPLRLAAILAAILDAIDIEEDDAGGAVVVVLVAVGTTVVLLVTGGVVPPLLNWACEIRAMSSSMPK